MKNKEDIKCNTCGHARRRHTALFGCLGNSTTTKNIYCDCFGFEFKEKKSKPIAPSHRGKGNNNMKCFWIFLHKYMIVGTEKWRDGDFLTTHTTLRLICQECGRIKTKDIDGLWNLEDFKKSAQP